ncbi:polysaccharide biosynthesis tyrosine autokinase [Sphingosinicellaceae bacterium]|nr:polysaccharide biosynthesis tyrosine autokinase [Sphingosinicellaceae bacterium]
MNDHSPDAFVPADRGLEGGHRRALRTIDRGEVAIAYDHLGHDLDRSAYADLWLVLQKWRWVVPASVAICLAIAGAVSVLTTKIYRASATLEISAEDFKVINTDETETASVSMARNDYLRTQYGLLASRSLAERVARTLSLATVPGYGFDAGDEPDRNLETATAHAAKVLVDGFKATPVPDSRLVTISFEAPDAAMAERITNAYASSFIASNLERKMSSTVLARQLLGKRLLIAQQRLEASDRAATEYAREADIINVQPSASNGATGGETSLTSASLVQVNAALSDAQRDRIDAEQKYRQVGLTTTQELTNPTIQALQQTRAGLSAQYSDMGGLYRDVFPQMSQLRARIADVDKSLAAERARVRSSLQADYLAAVAREHVLAQNVKGLKNSVLDINDRSIRYNILRRDVDTNRQFYDALLQRFKQVDVAEGIETSNVSLVDEAKGAPLVRPNVAFNLGAGLILGLVIGLLAAFICEFMDDSIKTPDDVSHKLRLPLLGAIPKVATGERIVDKITTGKGAIVEAYLSVRTSIEFGTSTGAPRTLLIASTGESEGKSTTAFALAIAFARTGRRVLLVDADMRQPSMTVTRDEHFGLSNLLAGSNDFKSAVFTTSTENLWVLPSGPVPPNPAELLASPRTAETIAMLQDMFDMIILDGPPVLGLADSPLLSSLAEGTVFTIEAGTRRLAARRAIARLEGADAQILGGLLTMYDVRLSGLGYGGYGSYGGYGCRFPLRSDPGFSSRFDPGEVMSRDAGCGSS